MTITTVIVSAQHNLTWIPVGAAHAAGVKEGESL